MRRGHTRSVTAWAFRLRPVVARLLLVTGTALGGPAAAQGVGALPAPVTALAASPDDGTIWIGTSRGLWRTEEAGHAAAPSARSLFASASAGVGTPPGGCAGRGHGRSPHREAHD